MPTTGTAPHLQFRPITASGSLHPDIVRYLQIFGVPAETLSHGLRSTLAYCYARFIGATPQGERTHIRAQVAEPTNPNIIAEAKRIERQFGLHDEVLPHEHNRYVQDLLLFMGTALPSRRRWYHAAKHMRARRVVVLSALDRLLQTSQTQDSRDRILQPYQHCLPPDPAWQPPTDDEIRIGTEAHLGRWIIQQALVPEQTYSELIHLDALAPSADKRASTDDTVEEYIKLLAVEEANLPEWRLKHERTIAVASSCPHWIFQALIVERHLRQARGDNHLKGNYRVVVAAYPLDWGLDTRIYVLGGFVRAILQWAMLNQPQAVPSEGEIVSWAARLS